MKNGRIQFSDLEIHLNNRKNKPGMMQIRKFKNQWRIKGCAIGGKTVIEVMRQLPLCAQTNFSIPGSARPPGWERH